MTAPSQKREARAAVTRAINNGTLVRQPCEQCGTKSVEAHHDDYEKPLEVRWLCVAHHRAHHRGQKNDGSDWVIRLGLTDVEGEQLRERAINAERSLAAEIRVAVKIHLSTFKGAA